MTVDGTKAHTLPCGRPTPAEVYVIGDFNGWDRTRHRLQPRGNSGIWEGFINGIGAGSVYKYYIVSRYNDYTVEKADPFAFYARPLPGPLQSSGTWITDGETMSG